MTFTSTQLALRSANIHVIVQPFDHIYAAGKTVMANMQRLECPGQLTVLPNSLRDQVLGANTAERRPDNSTVICKHQQNLWVIVTYVCHNTCFLHTSETCGSFAAIMLCLMLAYDSVPNHF